MPFKSKKQWRWAFATKQKFARRWAHATRSFRTLPTRKKVPGRRGRTGR